DNDGLKALDKGNELVILGSDGKDFGTATDWGTDGSTTLTWARASMGKATEAQRLKAINRRIG
ncbi:MAG: hypothetical protein Q8T11_04495, partial [Elusimicrobiota bacterium]|nr:hypothetical protein [Elusimicrobiota bacterium]